MTGRTPDQHLPGKKASWIELYFDLIFVFAVGQVTHLVVERHTVAGVAVALGLFMTLWWTWIGFALLYNRHGEDRARHRIIILAGTIPCAIAAVQLHGVLEGHVGGFALALAAARLVLAVAYLLAVREGQPSRRAGIGYTLSAAAFAASAAVPGAGRYVIWGIALVQEAGFLLLDANRRGARPTPDGNRVDNASRDRVRRNRRDAVRTALSATVSPGLAIDASHLSERFGLLMILLLGEVVITVCAAAAEIADHGGGYWLGLFAGLVLAGALWWIYFDSASRVSEYVLRASGGNPTMAYTIYAGGHVLPAFSLLVIAAGVNLSMHEDPPVAAAWLVSCGLAAYLLGTRAFTTGNVSSVRVRALRALAIVVTVCLALLYRVLPTVGVVAITACWAVLAAVVASADRGGSPQISILRCWTHSTRPACGGGRGCATMHPWTASVPPPPPRGGGRRCASLSRRLWSRWLPARVGAAPRTARAVPPRRRSRGSTASAVRTPPERRPRRARRCRRGARPQAWRSPRTPAARARDTDRSYWC